MASESASWAIDSELTRARGIIVNYFGHIKFRVYNLDDKGVRYRKVY